MLIGAYNGTLNEKRRTAIPKKFLEELGKKPLIAKWYEDCLIVVSSAFWEGLLTRLTGGKKTVSLGVRNIERFILGSAFELEPDEQGRVIIPQILADYAKLSKEIVFVGLSDRVEIWTKSAWDGKSLDLVKTTKDYIEKLSE